MARAGHVHHRVVLALEQEERERQVGGGAPSAAVQPCRLPEEARGRLQQAQPVGSDGVEVARVGGVQLRRQRDAQAGRWSDEMAGHDHQLPRPREADRWQQPGAEQQHPGQRRGSQGGVDDAELGRPARRGQEQGRPGVLGRDQPHHLVDVIEGALVAVEVPAWATAATRSATVGRIHGHAGGGEVGGGLGEPASVAGDAVEEDDRRPGRRAPAVPAEAVELDAVAGLDETADGVPAAQRPGFRVGGRAGHGCSRQSVHLSRTSGTQCDPGGSASSVPTPPTDRIREVASLQRPSRTTMRWAPRSSVSSSVAIDVVTTSPGLR